MSRASTRAGSPRAGRIGVAVIGFGWMGSVHTRAYVRLPHHFPELALRADLIAVADEVPGSGSGVLGDLASHAVDLARYLVGEISSVAADTAVFVPSRAMPTSATTGHVRGTGLAGPVENEDYVACLVRFA